MDKHFIHVTNKGNFKEKGKINYFNRRSRTRTNHQKCLKGISSKLSLVVDTLNKLNDIFNDWKEQTAAKTAQSLDTNFGALDGTLGQKKEVLEKINYPGNETTVSGQPEECNTLIEENALRIKKRYLEYGKTTYVLATYYTGNHYEIETLP